MAIPKMTAEEKANLESLVGKLTHVKDNVKGVVKQFHTGLFLSGEGGTSKSYTVLNELQKLRAKYVYHNTRLTARGLVDSLERSPTDIHFIEDAETLMEDKKTFGVFALGTMESIEEKTARTRNHLDGISDDDSIYLHWWHHHHFQSQPCR